MLYTAQAQVEAPGILAKRKLPSVNFEAILGLRSDKSEP